MTLLLSQCMDFEIIIQECSLGDCLKQLLKLFRSVEQNARQGYKLKKALNDLCYIKTGGQILK